MGGLSGLGAAPLPSARPRRWRGVSRAQEDSACEERLPRVETDLAVDLTAPIQLESLDGIFGWSKSPFVAADLQHLLDALHVSCDLRLCGSSLDRPRARQGRYCCE